MNAEVTKKIQEYLVKKFPKVSVFASDEPINDSIHCADYDVEGVLVRGRWISPPQKGDRQSLMFYIVTDQQKEEYATKH